MFRQRPPLAQLDARRICIIKPSALGDIIHALPVLPALRRRYPTSSITWIVNQAFTPLLHGHPDLTDVLPFDRGATRKQGVWAALRSARRLFAELRSRRFDLVIDLQGLFRSGLMVWATGAPRRLGLEGAREGSRWFYTDIVAGTHRRHTHAVDRYRRVVEALGANADPLQYRFPTFDSEQAWAQDILSACPRPWIGAAVGAMWLTKRWPPGHFARLLRRAQEATGGTVLFLGTTPDTPAAVEASASLRGPVLLLTGRTTLPQLTALLSRVDVLVANDTGPLHLANALGRPVVAPYTCTKAALTGPHGQLQRAVETKVWCAGSLLKRCARLECMAELTPERLWPVLDEVLQSWQANSLSA